MMIRATFIRQLLLAMTALSSLFFIGESSALIPQCVKNTATATYDDTKKLLSQHVDHPFYFGGSLGYGNTNWSEITTTEEGWPNYNETALAAPISASSSVFASGGFMGYQFSPHFMLEADYTHFNTTVVGFQTTEPGFNGQPIDVGNNYGISSLNTNTNSFSVLGKILVPLGFTKVDVYTDAGVAYVLRNDVSVVWDPQQTDPQTPFKLMDIGHFGPSFGFGLHYDFATHFFTDAAFQYTTGYGKANLQPAEYYIPFIYTVMFNLGIRV